MNIKERIELYLGDAITENGNWQERLQEGIREVILLLDGTMLWGMAQPILGDSLNQIDLQAHTNTFKKILLVERKDSNDSWRTCRYVPPSLVPKVTDTHSWYFCWERDPGFTVMNQKITVFPDATASINIRAHIPIVPSVDITADYIDGFIPDLVDAIIYYSLAAESLSRMSDIQKTLSNLTFPDGSVTAIDFSGISLPSYVGLPDIDFSDIDIPTISISISPPEFSVNNWFGDGSTDDAMLPTKGSINESTLNEEILHIKNQETDEEPELVVSAVNRLSARLLHVSKRMEAISAKWNLELSSYTAEIQEKLGKFQQELVKYRDRVTARIQAHTSQSTELVQAFLGEVQRYSQEVTKVVNKHQADLADITSKIQATNASLQSNSAQLSQWSQRYQLYFQKFLEEMKGYVQ